MNIKSEQEMLTFAEEFGKNLTGMTWAGDTLLGGPPNQRIRGKSNVAGPAQSNSSAAVIELVGDVGAGKTTFVRGLAKGLGVTTEVTSPSFTISKTYALPGGKTLVHYDFYRLSDPGLMQDDLEESILNPNNIVVIEWGESVDNILPKERTKITISYNDNDTREVTIK